MTVPPLVLQCLADPAGWDAYFRARAPFHRALAAGCLAKRLPAPTPMTEHLLEDAMSVTRMAEWEMVLEAREGRVPEVWDARLRDKVSTGLRTMLAAQTAPLSGSAGARRRNARAQAGAGGPGRAPDSADGRADLRRFVPLDGAETRRPAAGLGSGPAPDDWEDVEQALDLARFARRVSYGCLDAGADVAWVADLMLSAYTDPGGRDMSAADIAASTGFSVRKTHRLMAQVRQTARAALETGEETRR